MSQSTTTPNELRQRLHEIKIKPNVSVILPNEAIDQIFDLIESVVSDVIDEDEPEDLSEHSRQTCQGCNAFIRNPLRHKQRDRLKELLGGSK